MTFQLRTYQSDLAAKATAILRARGMVYLALEVRTGKTLTALETCKLYGARKVLFLTKLKAVASIENDYRNFGYTFDLKVTNYESIHKIDDIKNYDLFVLDECHNLSQYPKMAQRTQRLKLIIGRKPMIYLSATPVAEGYSKIFHQLHVSANSPYHQYKNFYAWARDYVKVKKVRRGIYEINDYSDADGERIKKDIAPIVLTYTQEQAGFVCPVQENFIEVEDDVVPYLIKKLFKDRVIIGSTGSIVADSPASLLGKCHQLSGGTCLLDNGKSVILSRKKADKIKDLFIGKKIAIFYQYVKELEVLKDAFGELITQSPEDFQEKKELIFAAQFISGKEGIALHNADAIIFYNISYSAVTYFQSRARLQSLERTTPANIYWLFTKGGIERRVYSAVSKKKNFSYSFFMRNVSKELSL